MIAVVGGTGTLGSVVVAELCERGEAVRILSRNRPGSLPEHSEHRKLDLAAGGPGAGLELAAALEGAGVVIDAANNPTRPGPLMLEGSARLIAACDEAQVGHFIGVSIVGCERVGIGYYKAKARQEELVRASQVPWSLLRATQFHELLDRAFTASSRFGFLAGGKAPLQPMPADSAGRELAGLATGEARLGAVEVAGPLRQTLGELAGIWSEATWRRRARVPVPLVGRSCRAIADGAFTLPGAEGAGPDFREWLAGRYGGTARRYGVSGE
jgi:uncharacterized protein YbjT (DUF2867 family)